MIICIVKGTSAQKLFPHSKARRVGLTPLRNPNHEDDDDTQKSDDQGIGEPALAPAGEPQTDACRKSLRSLRFAL